MSTFPERTDDLPERPADPRDPATLADITEEPHKQRHSDDANFEWAQYRKDYGVDPTDATHKAFHAGFKAAQKCAKDGGWSWPVDTAPDVEPGTDADRERVGLPMQMDPDRCVTAKCDYPEPHRHGFACGPHCPCGEGMPRVARVTKERDKWEGRFVALRHDVWVESGSRVAAVAAAAHGILARDDERGKS